MVSTNVALSRPSHSATATTDSPAASSTEAKWWRRSWLARRQVVTAYNRQVRSLPGDLQHRECALVEIGRQHARNFDAGHFASGGAAQRVTGAMAIISGTLGVGGGIGLVLTGLLVVTAGSAWGQRGPIKIGLFVPLTGPLAANAKEMVNGLTLFLGEHGNRLAGREVPAARELPPDAALRVDDQQPVAIAVPALLGICSDAHFTPELSGKFIVSRSGGVPKGIPCLSSALLLWPEGTAPSIIIMSRINMEYLYASRKY